jgi:hypothetical protein
MLQKRNTSINFCCVLGNNNYWNTVCVRKEFGIFDMGEWHFEEQHVWYNNTVHMGNLLGTLEMNGTYGKVMYVGNSILLWCVLVTVDRCFTALHLFLNDLGICLPVKGICEVRVTILSYSGACVWAGSLTIWLFLQNKKKLQETFWTVF